MNKSKAVLALALSVAAALGLASCSAGTSGSGADSGKLKVVATTTQLTDFAKQVGGDDIELTGLLPLGGSAHHFDPTPADLLKLGKADVLIVNGAGLDEFIDSAIEASGFSGKLIDASHGIDLKEAKAITLEGAEGNAEAEHDHTHDAGEEHSHESDAHGDSHGEAHSEEHDHDHGDLNPHLWTSPKFAEGMVSEIEKGLSEADKAHSADFKKQAAAYQSKLQSLDSWVASQFDRVPASDRVLVTGHDSLRYYLHEFGITFAGALLPSFEDNAEPSAAEIDALVAAIKQSGVKAIFVESSLSPKLAQTVAKDAGVKVIDSESLFVDSLGPKGSGAESYIDATVHNTEVILNAWGANYDQVPSDLKAR